MTAGKLFGVLVVLVAVVAGFELVRAPAPKLPPNSRVNDANFDALRPGMTEGEVHAVLGPPHTVEGGEIVRLQEADATDLEYEIQPKPLSTAGDLLEVYEGPNHERIRVLLSAREHTAMAIEYCVDDLPVLYKGHTSLKHKLVSPMSVARTVPSNPLQGECALSIVRRRALREANDAKDSVRVNSMFGARTGSSAPPPPPPTAFLDRPPPHTP
jgi:hypothetical protein